MQTQKGPSLNYDLDHEPVYYEATDLFSVDH